LQPSHRQIEQPTECPAADPHRLVVGNLELLGAGEHGGQRDVVVDARELDFCDSSGLTAFVQIANRLEPNGRLAIASPQPIVRRVLEVSGLVEAFVVADSVADAVERLTTA